MPDLVGQQINHYRLVHLQERTAFTEIYSAEQDETATPASFKRLRVKLSTGERALFLAAAQAFLAFTHPHIIRVIEVGEAAAEGAPFLYLVLEQVADQTLRQLHPPGTSLPLTTILAYVKPLAEALYYGHQRNFVHGDVKPGNIFTNKQEQIILSDFSAGLLSRLTNTITGTLAYVAPEQLSEQPLPASDQYALGIMVYEWLTGEPPFTGSAGEISHHHLVTPPPALRTKIPALPPEIEKVVLTALAKEPEKRFTTIQEFAYALEKALAGAREEHVLVHTNPLHMPAESAAARITSRLAVPSMDRSIEILTTQLLPAVPGVTPRAADREEDPPPARTRAGTIARRTLLVGLPALAVAAGGFAFWYFNQKTPTPRTTQPTALRHVYRGHAGRVTALAWSPDSVYLASGGDDHTVQIWHADTGQVAYMYRASSGSVPAVTWAPDSQRLASAGIGPTAKGSGPAQDKTVQVWYALTGQPISLYKGHTGGITDVAWDPQGERIASSSIDYSIQIWDAATGQHSLTQSTPPWYTWSLAWSPDATWLATGGTDTNLRVWGTTTGNPLTVYHGHTSSIEAVAWSPDGSKLATGSSDHTVRVWKMGNPASLLVYRGHTNYVNAVVWSEDGQYIASGGSDKTVQVWQATTGKIAYTYRGHAASVTTLCWSPDGKLVASGSEDGTVQVWQPF